MPVTNLTQVDNQIPKKNKVGKESPQQQMTS